MSDRRKVLAALGAGAVAIPVAALAKPPLTPSQTAHTPPQTVCCGGPANDENYFPNATVLTHDGERALFYNDLLRGKLVLVNFMSVSSDANYPVSENLAKVQQLLGDRLGRDVFMYSITDDPDHDTPAALKTFAEQIGAQPGWKFLTGDAKTLELIKGRFHVRRGSGGQQVHHAQQHAAKPHDAQHDHSQHGPGHDCALGLVRYGNVATGLWGSVAAKADPKLIVQRVDWVTPRPLAVGPHKRGGPPPLARRPTPPPQPPAAQDS